MKCNKCGNILTDDAQFCPKCGEKILVNQQNNQSKMKNKKKIIVIITLIVLSIVGIAYAVPKFTKDKVELPNNQIDKEEDVNNQTKQPENNNDELFDNSTDTKKYTFNMFDPSKITKEANNDNELTKGIEIKNIFFNPRNSSYGSIRQAYVYGINNNNSAVTVKITIEYYDYEGYRIERKINDQVVSAGKEFVIDLYVEDDSLNYTSVKLFYEAKKIKSYETEVDLNKIETSVNKIDNSKISVMVKNNSDTKVYLVNLTCLYYKDNELVFAVNGKAFGIEYGTIKEVNFYEHQLNLSDDYNAKEKIEYDNYKIIISSAYNSDSTNY